MADLPLPEELVGNSVTESQFKDALVRLITGITAYLDGYGAKVDVSLSNALADFLSALKTYKDDIDSRIIQYPFDDNILFNFADDDGSIVMQITSEGKLKIVDLVEDVAAEIIKNQTEANNATLGVNQLSKLIFNASSKSSLFDFADADGSIVMRITSDGKLNLVDMNEDVATAINENSNFVKAKLTEFSNKNLIEFVDSEENLIAYFDKDSKFYIVGLEADVVTAINSKSENGLSTKDTSNLSNYSYRDTFIPKAQNLLNFFRNNHDVGLLAPVPLQSFEQNFSIGTDWINQANIEEWGDYIPVKTPYGNNRGVVHPQILEFPNLFMGYRYILAITGYTNGNIAEENPFLLGSNDLVSFELLTPLIDEPESYTWEKGVVYNSDPFMFYDIRTGDLCLIFREYWADTSGGPPSQTHEFLYIRRTKDGKTWSERELMWGNQTGTVMSPAVIYDVNTETYHMYAVGRSNGSAYGLIHLTSKTLNNDWDLVGLVTPPLDSSVWHVDVKIIGDKQVLTFQNRVGNTSVGFKTGIASDFHEFTWADNWWNPPTYEVYKASFLPQFNDQNEMRLVYVWTTNHKPTAPLNYKLFVQPTPFLNVNYLEK